MKKHSKQKANGQKANAVSKQKTDTGKETNNNKQQHPPTQQQQPAQSRPPGPVNFLHHDTRWVLWSGCGGYVTAQVHACFLEEKALKIMGENPPFYIK